MITTQREARAEFWRQHPNLNRKKTAYGGTDYVTDTRLAFVDWIDAMHKNGHMSDRLVQTVTLGD